MEVGWSAEKALPVNVVAEANHEDEKLYITIKELREANLATA